MEEKDMKKMSKNNTTEVERTEYPCKKETQEEIKTPSLTEKRGRRHPTGRNSEKMENNSVDHQHTTQPVSIW